MAWLGAAGRGKARRGEAWQGKAWQGQHRASDFGRASDGAQSQKATKLTTSESQGRTPTEATMRTYEISITGLSPLLMHSDNLEWASALKKWRETPENKKLSVPGDDRSPAFTWIGSLYHNDQVVALPADNLMRCLMEGGAQVPVPGGKNGKTFKAQTQSGMLVSDDSWPVSVGGKTVDVAPVLALRNELDFDLHTKTAAALGFSLYTKRAKIGTQKHVRVRPRFDAWSTKGRIQVWDDQLTLPILRDIVRLCGAYKGLGDWRPSGRTPGPFGRFQGEVNEVKG